MRGPAEARADLHPRLLTSGMRVDLHLHTSASFDSKVEPQAVAERCMKLGLSPIFVTDHNTIDGALRLRSEMPGLEVVVGQEISTTRGEIIGLFLDRAVPAGLEPADAV